MAESKFNGQTSFKLDGDELKKFVAHAEACKSTKDIVLRELVYAFNRYCAAGEGRYPVLQFIEVIAPGYQVGEDGAVYDAGEPGRAGEIAANQLTRRAGDKLRAAEAAKSKPAKRALRT
jgi:hypothetical protein